MKPGVKIALIGGSLLLVGGIVYASTKKKSPAPPPRPAMPAIAAHGSTVQGNFAAQGVGGSYPLKLGSKGTLVQTLQTALGVTADGNWGPGTDAAFKEQTGRTQITDAGDFNDVITQINTAGMTVSAPAGSSFPDWFSGING